MENRTERIEVVIAKDEYWHDQITNLEIWDESFGRKIEIYGEELAGKVALGEISVKHLRQAVRLTNMLEAEVHQLLKPYGDDIGALDLEERLEAECRWFAHHVMKDALGRVKSQSQRTGLRNRMNGAEITETSRMPGMGSLELHDIRALREEAEQVE